MCWLPINTSEYMVEVPLVIVHWNACDASGMVPLLSGVIHVSCEMVMFPVSKPDVVRHKFVVGSASAL
jgi:hypothetical protein